MMTLNGDVGENEHSESRLDHLLIPLLDMANIACGFHASTPQLMTDTLQLCVENNVMIGAHPSYDDREGFGRRSVSMPNDELIHLVCYQIGALQSLCHYHNTQVSYFKPHGALYNDMMASPQIMQAMLMLGAKLKLPVMLLATGDSEQHLALAKRLGAELIFEAFADRRYQNNGHLTPRTQSGAVFHQPEQILHQANAIAREQYVITADDHRLSLKADTLCVHGDNMASVQVAQNIRSLLDQAKEAHQNHD
ncbi:5-oxoprolinase subunit PxpA [Vibrio hippocampi]|uniref:5-oxoprolinase subunit A 3 n=1 Tax=Vibrio hippocampi TaxID=654686 RepID=A0ABM8ZG16_9VIBR|nr:5-oxoprolinase subunit PxpA [Vibrio hippocampi]CAH0525122.1 5-oxoprolinase subunit A 3 [Vibrio hippocampi]